MGRQLRVLIVEDSELDAALLVRTLERNGYEVVHERVETRDAMRSALEGGQWDLVLSDYSMPTFSGPEALAVLREVGLDLPFIILSGTVGEETAVTSMRAGAHDFILKDRLARLLPAIERELREAEARRDRLGERNQAEKERERLVADLREAVRTRDVFLAIASHELRTPLMSLKLVAQGLQKVDRRGGIATAPPAALSAKFAVLVRQTARLESLIESLLDVSRIASNRMSLSCEAVDLADVVRGVIEHFDVLAQQSGSEIVTALSTAIGSWDRARIETVVSNLLSNALKFGRGKPIEVSVIRNANTARLIVVDRGIGIAIEAQARIFEKFERAVPDTHYGGFGLGLWIAREIVTAHRGTLTVTSEPGRGSTFVVELPTGEALVNKEGETSKTPEHRRGSYD